MSNGWTANLTNLFILAMLPIYIAVHTYFLPPSLSAGGIADAGFVSIITLTFLAGVFVTLLTLIFNTHFASSKLTTIAVTYLVVIYFLREADFHRLFTIEHVTRGKFYTMPDVPFWHKTIAALVFLILAAVLVYLLFKYTLLIWKKVRACEPWAVALLLWFAVLSISQLCDKSGLNDTHVGRVIEECSECWAAIFIFLTTIQIIPTLTLHTPIRQETTQLDELHSYD